MSTYKHPQNDPLLKNLHYAMEYSSGKPAIRVSSGSSEPQKVDLAAVSVTTLPLPTNASTETTLQQVKDAILGQTAIASTLWTDDSEMYYVRKDVVNQETGEITVTFTDPTGVDATPGTGLKPVSTDANTQTETTYFTATADGTGYETDDLIARLIILNTSVNPAAIKSTVWVNMVDGVVLPAGPLNADIVKTINDIAVTGSLPAGTNTIGSVNIENSLPAGTNTIGSVVVSESLPAGTNTIGSVVVSESLPAGTNTIGSVVVSESLPAGTNTIGLVGLAESLPAGTNTIGSVNIENSLPAGTNTIGSVVVSESLPAGTNTIGLVGLAESLPAGTNTIGSVNIENSLPAGTNTIGSVNIENWVDGEITATEFRVINTITGAKPGDVVALISSFDNSVTPMTSEVTLAINLNTMTLLDDIPDLTDLVKLGEESYSMTYVYDTNDNLTEEIRILGEIEQKREYTYDSNENLISRTSWTNV